MNLYVHGMGLWHRGYPNLRAWLEGNLDPQALRAPGLAFPAALRRRSTDICKMSCEAYCEARLAAGGQDERAALIFVSHLGEIATTMELLQEMISNPHLPISPMRFHNSVHNAAAGYLSIAFGLRRTSIALSAGRNGLAMGLLEASMLVDDEQDAVVVVTEESGPLPFDDPTNFGAGALAFWLAKKPHRDPARQNAALRLLPKVKAPASTKPSAIANDTMFNPGLETMKMAQGLARELTTGQAGTLLIGHDDEAETQWWVEIRRDADIAEATT
jgi:hypothetical protein